MKKIFVIGLCTVFAACGGSNDDTDARSASVPSGSTGSAYVSNDTVSANSPIIFAQNRTQAAAPAVAPVPAATSPDTVTAVLQTPAAAGAQTSQTTAAAPAAQPETPKPAAADDSAEIKRGEALIAKSDCLACHKTQEKLLGPSYKEVAEKYPNTKANIDKLADKIKKGGSGVWGAIPMSPHPTLSDEDAAAMVKYILSL